MSDCKSTDQKSGVYTGNQVGDLNAVGDLNFVAGGPEGSGLSAGTTIVDVIASAINRCVWLRGGAELNQTLLDQAFPFIDLQWIADIILTDSTTFRVSNRNIYVEDEDGLPRFYEARAKKSPSIKISLGEWLAENFEIGDLNLTLNNRDGFFSDFMPQGTSFVPWIGAEVIIRVGFGEIFSNYFEVFKGRVASKKGFVSTDTEIRLKCFDQFEDDDISIPTLTFDRSNFPDVDDDQIGSVLPIVYGDWTTDISSFGNVEAICSNAKESGATQFVWNISENALESITEIFLHRSNRTEDRDGPVKFINAALTIQPDLGRVIVPKGGISLEESVSVIERGKPGVGSGLNSILAESSGQNFLTAGIQVGDQVYANDDTVPNIVTVVTAGALTFTSGRTWAVTDAFTILTTQYTFKSGDRVSVKCKGKKINVMSVTRLADFIPTVQPLTLSIGLNQRGSFWFADNTALEIKELAFAGETLRTIAYSDIDGSIASLTGMAHQIDDTLWVFEPTQSKVYRFILSDLSVGLSFTTASVAGVGALIQGGALSIDDGNIMTLVDNNNGTFYRIDVLGGPSPVLSTSFNRTAFESTATDVSDTAHDVNLGELIVMDRNTNKVYRVDETTGALVSTIDLSVDVNSSFTNGVGVGYSIDGTLFFMNFTDLSIYNFNELADANNNPGFIARDLLQSFAGKTSADFDLLWNETARIDLSNFKARLVIDEKSTVIKEIHKLLTQFNTSFYLRFTKFSLFHINFSNFVTTGDTLREGDIKMGTFQPKREFNQYFNAAIASYKENKFTGKGISSDNYISPTGVELAKKEIQKPLDLPSVYRRSDLDILMPLFVRLAAADPEFVDVTVGFRFLFTQPNVFFNINFTDIIDGEVTGRRFANIPSFVRKITMDLDTMEFGLKLWSLGSTAFSGFEPAGVIAGGQNDPIVLTNLGTLGVIAPVGIITGVSGDELTIEGSGPDIPETRSSAIGGLAWATDYQVSIINGTTQATVETRKITGVSGNVITLDAVPGFSVLNTIKNTAGFISGGHYLKFAPLSDVAQAQSAFYTHFTKPTTGYPSIQTEEIEEQRSGAHNFDNGRLPYVLHPIAFTPPI